MAVVISTAELTVWLDQLLQPARFADYCPNGLQVEGRGRIARIVTGVTASQALLDEAVAVGADAVLVHHGWFWRGEDPTIKGLRRKRIATALQHELNVFAYHLPLDAHPLYGNNAQLAQKLNLRVERDAAGSPVTGGDKGLVWFGSIEPACRLSDFGKHVEQVLGREPVVIGDPDKLCLRAAWCTGAAQGMFDSAIESGVDVYITGEISEPNAHLARESGVAFVGAGHHATERYGIKALGEAIERKFGIEVLFFDINNPA